MDYQRLSKNEKSVIDWAIIDESAYMKTKNLRYRIESMKANLLYKRTKSTEANIG